MTQDGYAFKSFKVKLFVLKKILRRKKDNHQPSLKACRPHEFARPLEYNKDSCFLACFQWKLHKVWRGYFFLFFNKKERKRNKRKWTLSNSLICWQRSNNSKTQLSKMYFYKKRICVFFFLLRKEHIFSNQYLSYWDSSVCSDIFVDSCV